MNPEPMYEKRDYWWRKSAEQGNARAMWAMAYWSLYGSSKHIPKDRQSARTWFEKAQVAGFDDPLAIRAYVEEEAKIVAATSKPALP